VRNMKTRAQRATDVSEEDFLLLCDAQTSGGLIVSLPEAQAERYAARCRELGASAASVVGRVMAREADGRPIVRVAADRKES
jgi:selenophosphate synthase